MVSNRATHHTYKHITNNRNKTIEEKKEILKEVVENDSQSFGVGVICTITRFWARNAHPHVTILRNHKNCNQDLKL